MTTLLELIRQAGQVALNEQKKMTAQTKADGSIVTNGDLAVSRMLEAELKNLYPDYDVFSEENCKTVPTNSKIIIIDPIDGTLSYHRREETWCILVGFVEEMKPVKGFVYQPTTQKMFRAEQGQGAFLEKPGGFLQSLKAKGQGPLAGSRSFKDVGESEFYKNHGIEKVDLMYSAALKILKVASGEIDLYANFQKSCSVWDLVAPQCILEEAGGRLEYANPVVWNLASPRVPERFCAVGQRLGALNWTTTSS